MAEEKKPQNQLNIELPEDIAEGEYSNLAIIAHSNSEFVVDFVRIVPNATEGQGEKPRRAYPGTCQATIERASR